MSSKSISRTFTWALALSGIASILFGVLALVWPGLTLGALVFLFGFYAIVGGVLALVQMFDAIGQHQTWWPALVIAIVDLVAAAFIFTNPGLTAITLLYVVAFWAIIGGLFEIFASLVLARFLTLLAGVLTVVAGFVLLGNPRDGALALVLVIGMFAIVRGIILLIDAFRWPDFADIGLSNLS
jgi:uncharacterized membrane protein HdeD (DUF308 family)